MMPNNIKFIASFFGKTPEQVLSLNTDTISNMVEAVEEDDIMKLHHLGYIFNEGQVKKYESIANRTS
jgi:hypothetical protein